MSFPVDTAYSLLTIILLDLVLAGDNAIVIALAARKLPHSLQRRAIFWGSAGAVAVRIILTSAVVWLLELPCLMLAGGVLLLPIAWKLLQHTDAAHEVNAATGFWSALRTIIMADALMGMDNVLAIAGAADGNLLLVVIGLLISVPLVVVGSTMLLKLIERFHAIIYLGAAAIAFTAARMFEHDVLTSGWFNANVGLKYALDASLVLAICGGGWWARRRQG